MLYSCTHMATVGVKGLIWSCGRCGDEEEEHKIVITSERHLTLETFKYCRTLERVVGFETGKKFWRRKN